MVMDCIAKLRSIRPATVSLIKKCKNNLKRWKMLSKAIQQPSLRPFALQNVLLSCESDGKAVKPKTLSYESIRFGDGYSVLVRV